MPSSEDSRRYARAAVQWAADPDYAPDRDVLTQLAREWRQEALQLESEARGEREQRTG